MALTKDRKVTVDQDLVVGHVYEVAVRAVAENGKMQAVDLAPKGTILLAGKITAPGAPTTLAATPFLYTIALTWTNPTNSDYAVTEIWRHTANVIGAAVKVGEIKGSSYLDNLGASGLTRYYWVRARNTSGIAGAYNATPGVSGTTAGVVATDIANFAVTATKMFTQAIVLTGDTWGTNAGQITWNAHTLVYNGVSYAISAGATNTTYVYVYWVVGASTYSLAYTHPTTLGANASFMIACNVGGVVELVWNSSANMVIGTAFIMDAAITNAKIGLLAVDTAQIAALAVTSAKVTALDATKITTGTLVVARTEAKNTNPLADQTSANTAAGISGQGALATLSVVETAQLGTTVIVGGYIKTGLVSADNINTGTLLARPVKSAASGARVEMFPDANTGIVIYDNAGTPAKVFEALVGGADVGDVTIGDFTGGKYARWDKSAAAFTVQGLIQTAGGTGQRMVLDNSDNTLKFYNASNVNTLTVDDDAAYSASPLINMDSARGGSVYIYRTAEEAVGMTSTPTAGGSPARTQILITSALSGVTGMIIGYGYTGFTGNFIYFMGPGANTFEVDKDANVIVSGGVYKINGTQVVGARVIDARCDDAINSGDATTDGVIDSLRDAMITHGLIAAA